MILLERSLLKRKDVLMLKGLQHLFSFFFFLNLHPEERAMSAVSAFLPFRPLLGFIEPAKAAERQAPWCELVKHLLAALHWHNMLAATEALMLGL